MSDKQLTVAELLARAGKTGEDSETPRRRRRRSLEEGGISVAELTGSIPRVKEKPQDARHSNSPIDGPEEEQVDVEPETGADTAENVAAAEETAAQADLKLDEKLDEKEAAPEETPAEESTVEPADEPKEVEEQESPAAEETGVLPVVEDTAEHPKLAEAQEEPTAVAEKEEEEPLYAFFDENGEEKPYLPKQQDDDSAEDTEQEGEGSWLATIGLAIAGIVLGIIVFLGFQRLWASGLSNLLVAVMAVAVIALMVAVVHVLRTARDGFSMVLAGIVGVLMTFGPFIITYF